MDSQHIGTRQQAFVAYTKRIARWVKGDMRYRGPANTDDLASVALVKLVKRTTYASALQAEPERLMGMMRKVMRNVIHDRRRYDRALRRQAQHEPQPVVLTPEYHEQLGQQQRALAVRAVLAQAANDDGPGGLSPADKRSEMLRAFDLRWQGLSHREIAAAMDISKGTVNNWLKDVQKYVRRELRRKGFELAYSSTSATE